MVLRRLLGLGGSFTPSQGLTDCKVLCMFLIVGGVPPALDTFALSVKRDVYCLCCMGDEPMIWVGRFLLPRAACWDVYCLHCVGGGGAKPGLSSAKEDVHRGEGGAGRDSHLCYIVGPALPATRGHVCAGRAGVSSLRHDS